MGVKSLFMVSSAIALLNVVFYLAVALGIGSVGVSALKLTTNSCSQNWKVDEYVAGDLFCDKR